MGIALVQGAKFIEMIDYSEVAPSILQSSYTDLIVILK